MNKPRLTLNRYWAAKYVARNWRVRQRLPRLTALAYELGWIKGKTDAR